MDVFKAPALPLGSDFEGIVHVHGAVDRPETMVLTDADFGRAYLTEGWARRFLVDLFRSFTVLFVGYSHGDLVMHYLARALPAGAAQRFVLTDDAEAPRWSRLGIATIPFPKSDYRVLSASIGKLAEHRSRGILGWQHLIGEIANNYPPIDEAAEETLDEAFSYPARTRFFTANAKDPAWIGWLDSHEHLIKLFRGRAALTEPQRELAKWLAKEFPCDHADEVWRVIGRHGMQVHPKFWQALADALGPSDSNIPDQATLSRWVSVLLATAPSPARELAFEFLAERCIERKAIDSLIAIFEHVTTVILRFSRFYTGLYGDAESEAVPTPLAELDAASDDYRHTAAYVWENGLSPNLGQISSRLIAYVVANLEGQHRTLSTWEAVWRNWDPLSRSRFAIESDDHTLQGQHREVGDILIDAARDCLEWLVSNAPEEAAQWCDRLALAPAPILRRLAIHGVIERNLHSDDTIDWMLQHSCPHDELARHERIRALKTAYPRATEERRRAVIKDILDCQWLGAHDEKSEEFTVSRRFFWLERLLEAAPNCRLLEEALQNLRQQYPDFQWREDPDVDQRSWLDDAIPLFPWKPEELVARPACEWTDKLLTYQPSDPLQPDRWRLLDAVAGASAQNIDWGIDLAKDLLQKGCWDADLWPGILRSWSTTKPESRQYRRALEILRRTELHENHPLPIVKVLQTLVRNADLPDHDGLVKVADTVAVAVWESAEGQEIPEECDDWLIEAWSHPAGVLIQFWIDSLAYWNSREDHRLAPIEKLKKRSLSIVRNATAVGRLGRCVLARNLSMLLAIDEVWTKNNMLPLFYDYPKCADHAGFAAIWDGILSGTINPEVAEIMKIPFLYAVSRMGDEPPRRRKRFIESYTFMLALFAGDPVGTWIPELLIWADEDERIVFLRSIHERLENMNEVQQAEVWHRWLKQYWNNRVQGIPNGLLGRETWHMLRWLPLLQGVVFSEAVDVAIRMSAEDMEPESGRDMVFTLNESDLPTAYPAPVAKLLIYLGRCENYRGWSKVGELVDKLRQHNLPDELKKGLRELVARRGLHDGQ